MPDHIERDGMTNLPMLTGVDELINWCRRVKSYLQQQDIELFELTDRPDSTLAAQHKRWIETNIKSKSEITLMLSDGPLAQISTVIDDDERTAKNFWTELIKVYRMSSTQMVINIERERKPCHLERTRSGKRTSKIFTDSSPTSHLIISPFWATGRCPDCFGIFLKGLKLSNLAAKSSGTCREGYCVR